MVLWAVAFPPFLQQQESKVARRLGCLDAEKREVNRAERCGSLVTSVIIGNRCSCIRDGSGTEVRGQRVITDARGGVHRHDLFAESAGLHSCARVQGCGGLETRLASPFHIPSLALWQRMDRFWTRRALEIPSSEGGRITARRATTKIRGPQALFVDAFDSYIVFFYVEFFVRDPIRLCVELVSLYTADPVRRLHVLRQ